MEYSLQPHGLFMEFLSSWNSPDKNSLLQGTFPTQGLNLGLLNCRQILYYLSHQGRPHFTIINPKIKGGGWQTAGLAYEPHAQISICKD